MAPQLAKTALLKIVAGGSSSLIIDGEEFPWHISADDISITQHAGLNLVSITLLVESIEVTATLSTTSNESSEEMDPKSPRWGVPGDYLILQEDTPIPTNKVNVLKVGVEDLSLPYLVRTGKDLDAWVWSMSPDPNGRENEAFSWEEVARGWRGDKLTVIS
jgi:hypothetical protein